MTPLTDNEARTLIYFVIGVSSESSDQAYKLSLAGHTSQDAHGNTLLHPTGASGYSIGTLQSDLGQSGGEVATQLTDAFQAWTRVHHPGWTLTPVERTKTISDLSRNGHLIKERDGGRDLDSAVKSRVNTFLASEEGVTFVHNRDVEQVNKLMTHVVEPLRVSSLFQQASPEDQARMIAISAKAYNQSERWGGRIVRNVVNGSYHSVADLSDAIDHFPDYMKTGRNAALRGTDLFNAMQHATSGNAMHASWRDVVSNPLVNPARLVADTAHPNLAYSYPAVKDIFVDPVHGQQLVHALEAGGSYAKVANGRGFYAQGSDFVEWAKNGYGRAFVGGEWSAISTRDIATATNRDNTLDVGVRRDGTEQRLLHITHASALSHSHSSASRTTAEQPPHPPVLHEHDHGSEVRDLQTQLALLGLRGAAGAPLISDGAFGLDTKTAVEAFQRGHNLPVDGLVGPKTHDALIQATQPQLALQPLTDASHPGHEMFRQALEGVHYLDAQHGRTPDQRSHNLAAALAVAARSEGLTRIDQVMLTGDASRAYAVQENLSSPVKHYIGVGITEAINTSVAQSSLLWKNEVAPVSAAHAPQQSQSPQVNQSRTQPSL